MHEPHTHGQGRYLDTLRLQICVPTSSARYKRCTNHRLVAVKLLPLDLFVHHNSVDDNAGTYPRIVCGELRGIGGVSYRLYLGEPIFDQFDVIVSDAGCETLDGKVVYILEWISLFGLKRQEGC